MPCTMGEMFSDIEYATSFICQACKHLSVEQMKKIKACGNIQLLGWYQDHLLRDYAINHKEHESLKGRHPSPDVDEAANKRGEWLLEHYIEKMGLIEKETARIGCAIKKSKYDGWEMIREGEGEVSFCRKDEELRFK